MKLLHIRQVTTSLLLLITPAALYSQYYFSTSGSNQWLYTDDLPYHFGGHDFRVLQATSLTQSSLVSQDGAAGIWIPSNGFHLFANDSIAVVGSATFVMGADTAGILDFGLLDRSVMAFDDTIVLCQPGDTLTINSHILIDTKFDGFGPDFLSAGEVADWYTGQELFNGDTSALFHFSIPANQAPGDYGFFMRTGFYFGDSYMRKFILKIKENLPPQSQYLEAWYPFNDNADDETGNGNDGTNHDATLTTDRFGNPGNAYQFDGIDDYMNLGSGLDFTDKSFSIGVWNLHDTKEGTMFYQGIPVDNKRLDISYYSPGYTIAFNFYNNILSADKPCYDTINWNHWVFTYDASTGDRKIYLNGAVYDQDVAAANYSGSGNLILGAAVSGSSGNYPGKLDDVCIYDCTLSEPEILQLYANFYPSDTFYVHAGDRSATIYWDTLNWSYKDKVFLYRDDVLVDSIKINTPADTTYTDTGLINYHAYSYYIRSKDVWGNMSIPSDTITVMPCDLVEDYDGNIYQTVKIGDQVWMKENLKATHFPDGSAIPIVEGTTEWASLASTDKAMCYYNNDPQEGDVYGVLYNWAAVMNGASGSDENPSGIQGICPVGWQIPSDGDWKELETCLGMSPAEAEASNWRGSDQGGRLKDTGTMYWTSPNTGATNESGFTALPAGYRDMDGSFGWQNKYGYFWTASGYNSSQAWRRFLGFDNSQVYRSTYSMLMGQSVRCFKDFDYRPYLERPDTVDFGIIIQSHGDSISSVHLLNTYADTVIIDSITGIGPPFSIDLPDAPALQDIAIAPGGFLQMDITLSPEGFEGTFQDTILLFINGMNTGIILTTEIELPPPLDPPEVFIPENLAEDRNIYPILQWNKTGGAEKFHVRLARDGQFSDIFDQDSTLTDSLWRTGPLKLNTTYYWQVRTGTNASGWGSWSDTLQFRTMLPEDHESITIRNSFTSPGSRPTGLTWDGYHLWMIDNLQNLYKLDTAGNVLASYTISGSSDDRGLFWKDNRIWVLGSTNKIIDTLGNETGSFDLQYWWHSGGEWDGTYLWFDDYNSSYVHKHTEDGTEILNWEATELFGHTTGLAWDGENLWVGGSGEGFTLDIFKYSVVGEMIYQFDLSTIGLSPEPGSFAALAWDGRSLWYATDDQFKIYRLNVPYYHEPPATPGLSYPADGASGLETDLVLSWEKSAGATTYHLQIATDETFTDLVTDDPELNQASSRPGTLFPNANYYWRVRAGNGAGTSDWSASRSFSTSGTIPAPENLQISACHGEITVYWAVHPQPNIVKYRVYRDLTSPAVTLYDSVPNNDGPEILFDDSGTSDQTYHYRVSAVDDSGNESHLSEEDSVTLYPPVNIGEDIDVCGPDTIQLAASEGFISYLWSVTDSMDNTLAVSKSGTYWLMARDSNSCDTRDTVRVDIREKPSVELGDEITGCGDQSVVLDPGIPGADFEWSVPDSSGPTLTVHENGSYWLHLTDAYGCENSDTVDVTFYPAPEPDLGDDLVICPGETTMLDAGTGFTAYQWSVPDSTGQSLNVDAAGTYAVTVADNHGCTGTDTIDITYHDLPPVSISGPADLCDGDSGILDAGEGYASYTWSVVDSTERTLLVNAAGTYSVAVTDNYGCASSDTLKVVYHALPEPSLGPDTAICEGTIVVLDAGEGYAGYRWPEEDSVNRTFHAGVAGTVGVEVWDEWGCRGSDEINVIVNALPEVDLGEDVTACEGSVIALDAGAGYKDLEWSVPDSIGPMLHVTTSGSYFITVTGFNDCRNSDTVVVTFRNKPEPDLGEELALCEGVPRELDAGDGYAGYHWSTGSTDQVITVTETGTYWVRVNDETGCAGSDTVEAVYRPDPEISINLHNNPIYLSDSCRLTASGASSYAWTPPDRLSNTTGNPVFSKAVVNTVYRVTGTDQYGCKGSDSAEVLVFCNSTADNFPIDSTWGILDFRCQNRVYRPDQVTTWLLLPKSGAQYIILNLNYGEFDIHPSDTLRVYELNGDNNNDEWELTGKFNNSMIPGDSIYASLAMMLELTTDEAGTGKGFYAYFKTDLADETGTYDETTGLKIYPNPFRESTIIEFPNSDHSAYRLIVYDLSGKVHRVVSQITSSRYELTREGLNTGFYIIRLVGPELFTGRIFIE